MVNDLYTVSSAVGGENEEQACRREISNHVIFFGESHTSEIGHGNKLMYAFTNDWMPNWVVNELEKIMRSFLQGKRQDRYGVHLVNWEIVCQEKGEGGSG